MSERATCWSITINNPTEGEVNCQVPGWKLSGQYEEGEHGTRHFQGMLTTPQVRFSAVKRVFPRGHIEVCRNKTALAKYTSKEETRVATYEATGCPSLFEYQDTVARLWDEREWNRRTNDDHHCKRFKYDYGDMALHYVDELVSLEIQKGQRGIEFIAINPMWRSSWKKFYSPIIKRYAASLQGSSQSPQVQSPLPDGTADAINSGEESASTYSGNDSVRGFNPEHDVP